MKSEKLNPIKNIFSFFTPIGEQWVIPIFYLQLILLAEVLAVLRDQGVGFIMHSITLIILLIHGGLERRLQKRRFLISLALAPLIRTINFFVSAPLRDMGEENIFVWYSVIGAVMFVAGIVALVMLELSPKRVGFTLNKFPLQLLIGLSGIGSGVIEYLILRPDPPEVVPELSLQAIWVPALILLIFTGLLEEFIFRGLLQETSIVIMGKFGLTFASLIFAVLHVSYNSFLDVIFVFSVGLFFGYCVLKTGSFYGVSLAHGLNNIMLFLILPFIWNLPGAQLDVNPAVETPQGQATATYTIESIISPSLTPSLSPTPDLTISTAEETLLFTPSPTFTELVPSLTLTQIPTTVEPLPTQSPDCTPPAGWVIYTVQLGDTLFSISKAYGISWIELQEANCLTGTLIVTGEKIYVPNVPTITSPVVDTSTPSNTPKPPTNTPLPTSPPATSTDTPLPTSTPTTTPTPTPLPTSTFTPMPP